MTRLLNLVLVPQTNPNGYGDFARIAELIRERCDDITPHVVLRKQLWWRQPGLLTRPTLYVAFYHARGFRPLRGVCLHGADLGKSAQYRILRDAGVRVPDWAVIEPGHRYDPGYWGSHVLVKPDRGRMGGGIRLRRTGKIRFDKDCEDGRAHLLQRFVHTGPHPVSYRVLTFLGEVLLMHRNTNIACGNALTGPDCIAELGGHNPVASSAKGRVELVLDDAIMAMAQRIARQVFPDIPLLGQDIIREASTGELYCLEVNPVGSTWHFSAPVGVAMQQANGIHFETQFGAFEITARALIEATRRLAR